MRSSRSASSAARSVVEQGKKSDALYIILTGRARVMSTDSRGREVILATLHPGDYIGEMSLIDDEPHSATVRTEVQTDVLMLGRDAFARCLPENSSMSYNIMRGLVQRLRHADRKIESLALMDVYGRVARSLLEFARRRRRRQPARSATRSRARTSPRWSAPRARWSAAS